MKPASFATILAAAVAFQTPTAAAAGTDDEERIERGRYLVLITDWSDCHTTGYAEAGGEVPESGWLTGDGLCWQGPWRTTCATNQRLADLTEDA